MVTNPLMLFTNAVYTYPKLSDNFYSSSCWIQGPTFLSSQSTLNSSLPFRISWFLCFLLLLWCWHLLFNWHQSLSFFKSSVFGLFFPHCVLSLSMTVYIPSALNAPSMMLTSKVYLQPYLLPRLSDANSQVCTWQSHWAIQWHCSLLTSPSCLFFI